MKPLLQTLARSWPFTRGKTRFFTDVILATPLRRKVAAWENPTPMKRGFELFCRGDEYTSLWFRLYGEYEPKTQDFITSHLSPGLVFLDVGANLGLYSLSMAKNAGCECFAFEPNPTTYAFLEKSIAHNSLSGLIHPFQVAVSREAGELEFVENPENAGDSSLQTDATREAPGSRHVVQAVALDRFGPLQTALAEGARKVGVIKMDVQGAEADAIDGMKELITRDKPFLVVEMDDAHLRRFGSSEAELRAEILAMGYASVRAIEDNEIFRPLS